MLFSFVYALVRGVLRMLGPSDQSEVDRDIELLVLRHQLKILRRQNPRPRLRPHDRVLLAAASRLLPKGRWGSFLVSPRTLLRWHRELVRRKWTYRRKGRPGRRRLDADVREVILRMAKENPRWGYRRIKGELRKLGVDVSACGGQELRSPL